MKLNTDAPEQHLAILCVAGFCVFVSLISTFTGGDDDRPDQPEQPQGSYQETGITKYANPQLSWYERIFCRGYQRSASCSNRLIHPLRPKMEELGIEINEAPAEKTNAVDYNGSLPVNRAISGRVKMKDRPWGEPAWLDRLYQGPPSKAPE